MQRPFRSGYYPGQKPYPNLSNVVTDTSFTTRPARFTGLFLVGAILLMLVLAGCGEDGPTSISKAEMAAGIENNSAVGAGTVFKPTDPFFTAVNLTNPKPSTRVKAVLTAISTADGTQNRQILDNEITTTNSESFVSFKFTLPNPWPVGKYKVYLLLDGTAAQTLNFEIQ